MSSRNEWYKSVILIILVLSSIIFTYFLWYGSPLYHEAKISFLEPSSFHDFRNEKLLIFPEEIKFTITENESHVIRRGEEDLNKIWMSTLRVMDECWNIRRKPTSYELDNPMVTITFDPPYPAHMLWNSGETDLNFLQRVYLYPEWEYLLIVEGIKQHAGPGSGMITEQIVLRAEEETWRSLHTVLNSVFLFTNYQRFWSIIREDGEEEDKDDEDTTTGDIAGGGESERADDVSAESRAANYSVSGDNYRDIVERDLVEQDLVEIEGKIMLEVKDENTGQILFYCDDLIVPMDEHKMHSRIVLAEDELLPEKMLHSIFVDKNLARKIEEQDGTILYTDGERSMKASHVLEYTAYRLEKGSVSFSYRGAVRKSGEFISYYGGWPEWYYISDISRKEQGYRVFWRYYEQGYPLLGQDAGIEMNFNDWGIFKYRRSIFKPKEKSAAMVKLAGAEKAAVAAAGAYRTEMGGGDILLLSELYPAYYIYEGESLNENINDNMMAADGSEENENDAANESNNASNGENEEKVEKAEKAAIPVWAAVINNRTVLLDAVNLSTIRIINNEDNNV